jgi:hypothetical protein
MQNFFFRFVFIVVVYGDVDDVLQFNKSSTKKSIIGIPLRKQEIKQSHEG